jgi:hypothetical protein
MDRREALKKMMAGGAVVAGASMVSSSPVFAAGSVGGGTPVVPVTAPPPATAVNDKRFATWQLAAPDVSCSTGTMVSSYGTINMTKGNISVMLAPSGTGDTATLTVAGTGPGNSPFRQGDEFEAVWHVTYECMSNGVPTGCQKVDYTYRYVNLANGNPNWQPYPSYPQASPPRPCSP